MATSFNFMSPFNAETVEEAVIQFYQNQNGLVNDINPWLTKAQTSVEAWSFSWQLMQLNKKLEVQYFGANTLYLKISRFWHEIPEDQIVILRGSLMELLSSHVNSPKLIVTKICIIIGNFILHALPRYWPDSIDHLLNIIAHSEHIPLQKKHILEILTVIPEENLTLPLSLERKNQVKNALIKAAENVFKLIQKELTDPNSSFSSSSSNDESALRNELLQCACNWMRVGVYMADQQYIPLVDLIFNQINDSSYIKIAVDSLVSLFKCYSNHRFPRTMVYYLQKVVSLEELFVRMCNNPDDELSMADGVCQLTKLFVAAAENNISLLISNFHDNEEIRNICYRLLSLIIKCVGVKGFFPVDETSSDLTFGFWYNMQDELLKGQVPAETVTAFRCIYMELFKVMCRKSSYPPYHEFMEWCEDDRETFRCYRQDISDAAAYFISYLDQSMLVVLFEYLKAAVEKNEAHYDVPWEEFEWIMYMLTSVMEGGSVDDGNHAVAMVFEYLPRVPCSHHQLVIQIMFFLASCADLMEDNVAMFTYSVPFLLRGIVEQELTSAATLSLKDIFFTNRRHAKLVARQVLDVIRAALESNKLIPGDQVRLMCVLGYILSDLSTQESLDIINIIVTPHVIVMGQLTSSSTSQQHVPMETRNMILDKLKMLAGFFSSFAPTNQTLSDDDGGGGGGGGDDGGGGGGGGSENRCIFMMTQQLMPLIKMMMQGFVRDEIIINDLSEMLKRLVGCLLSDISPMLRELIDVIITTYNVHAHTCLLDLVKSIMIVFSGDSAYQPLLQSLFTCICNRTLASIETNPKNQTDLIEGLMLFLSQMVKKYVGLLRDQHCDLNGLFNAGIVGVCMNEQATSKASCLFLSSLISNVDEASPVIQTHARRLIEVLFRGIAGEIPRHNLNPLCDVLHSFNIKYFDLMCCLLNEVVSIDGFPHNRVTRQEKEQFAKIIIGSQKSKRKLKESLNEYAMTWRGFIGTEYALQTNHNQVNAWS